MPTERFAKLPEGKKKRIGDIILEEFQETPDGSFHITQVARRGSISRASLYTYFTGKEDMLLFSAFYVRRKIREKNCQFLVENGGNYWKMMKDSLEYQMSLCKSHQVYMLIYLPWLRNTDWKPEAELTALEEYKSWIYENCTVPERHGMTREEFDMFQDISQAFLMVTLQDWLSRRESRACILENFNQRLRQMEAGPAKAASF